MSTSNVTNAIERITRNGGGEHILTLGGHEVLLRGDYVTVDGLSVVDYYCSVCFWEAAQNGGANADTGTGSCEHKQLVAEARAIVKGGREMQTLCGRWDRHNELVHDCPMTGRSTAPFDCYDCTHMDSIVESELPGVPYEVTCDFVAEEQDWADYCEEAAETRAVLAGVG